MNKQSLNNEICDRCNGEGVLRYFSESFKITLNWNDTKIIVCPDCKGNGNDNE